MFVIAVKFHKVVCYKHEFLLQNYAKPNLKVKVVCYNREFVITMIVITEFDCIDISGVHFVKSNGFVFEPKDAMIIVSSVLIMLVFYEFDHENGVENIYTEI